MVVRVRLPNNRTKPLEFIFEHYGDFLIGCSPDADIYVPKTFHPIMPQQLGRLIHEANQSVTLVLFPREWSVSQIKRAAGEVVFEVDLGLEIEIVL